MDLKRVEIMETSTQCQRKKFLLWQKVAVEYVKLCGYGYGEIGGGHQRVHNGLSERLTLDEIASQLGTSKTNLKRALSGETSISAGYDKNYGYQLLLNKKTKNMIITIKISF